MSNALGTAIRQRTPKLNVLKATLSRILIKARYLHAYHNIYSKENSPIFEKKEDFNFAEKSIFRDNAHFYLLLVNEENYRIFS